MMKFNKFMCVIANSFDPFVLCVCVVLCFWVCRTLLHLPSIFALAIKCWCCRCCGYFLVVGILAVVERMWVQCIRLCQLLFCSFACGSAIRTDECVCERRREQVKDRDGNMLRNHESFVAWSFGIVSHSRPNISAIINVEEIKWLWVECNLLVCVCVGVCVGRVCCPIFDICSMLFVALLHRKATAREANFLSHTGRRRDRMEI